MTPPERKELALEGLTGTKTRSDLATEHEVSRKFLRTQIEKADEALDSAFGLNEEAEQHDGILYEIQVTKKWLRQVVLCLVLHCHSSFRGAQDFLRDALDDKISLGTIHNIVMEAYENARRVNAQEDLSRIEVGAHDEIFQGRKPVLVGVDPISTYDYLLAQEDSRDAETWAIHLLYLSDRGLKLKYTVADFGKGLRAGQAEAWPGVPCRGDVFHAELEMGKMVIYLENRAYGCIGVVHDHERKIAQARRKCKGCPSASSRLGHARKEEAQSVQLAEDIRLLTQWVHEILELRGPDLQTRRELFDFIVGELKAREHLARHRIRPVRVTLENQRDHLLAFGEEIDQRLAGIAQEYGVPVEHVREVFELGRFASDDPVYRQKNAALSKQLGPAYPAIQQAVEEVAETTVRASSIVENINSRLRPYFFLRRQLGPRYLELLRFFLNHRRYPRSRKDARAQKSPAEILQGKSLPGWLEQLGFAPFRRKAG